MSILQNRVLISIKSGQGERRFYNRITQGFTCRWNGHSFSDTTGCSVRPYFKGFKQHNQSDAIFAALCESDSELVYRKFTFGHLVRGNAT